MLDSLGIKRNVHKRNTAIILLAQLLQFHHFSFFLLKCVILVKVELTNNDVESVILSLL